MRWKFTVAFVFMTSFLGCGHGGPKAHPVQGTVVVAGGEVAHLAGGHIEAMLTSDPTQRASGIIQPDGAFKLETLHAGAGINGARPGSYRVRLILPDDDKEQRRKAVQAVAARYLDFKTSGLTFEVPTSGPITLAVAPR